MDKPIELNCARPSWTVLYNIVSEEANNYVGTGWEFFTDQQDAMNCYLRHQRTGNVPTLRPYHHGTDAPHLGAAHAMHFR